MSRNCRSKILEYSPFKKNSSYNIPENIGEEAGFIITASLCCIFTADSRLEMSLTKQIQ